MLLSSKEHVQVLQDHLQALTEDGRYYLYNWGLARSMKGEFIKADLVSLSVIRVLPTHISFSRLFGSMQKSPVGRKLAFSPGNFRVTSGNRRGAIIRASGKQDNETVCQAGMSKCIALGDDPIMLSPERNADNKLAEELMMSSIYQGQLNVSRQINLPGGGLFMTLREDQQDRLRVKQSSAAATNLMALEGYDPDKTLVANAKVLAGSLGVPMSHGRIAYPFILYDGKGVPAFRDSEDWQEQRATGVDWLRAKTTKTTDVIKVTL